MQYDEYSQAIAGPILSLEERMGMGGGAVTCKAGGDWICLALSLPQPIQTTEVSHFLKFSLNSQPNH